jgi:uncharacterized protein DUF6847
MKLAEALMLRADAQKRIDQLRERFARSARVQEGEQAPESIQELLDELTRALAQWTDMVKRINRTNAATSLETGKTLTDALAERDALSIERDILASLIEAATGQQRSRYPNMSPIKYFRTVNVAEIQKRMDDLSRRYRELDALIQAMNWNTDLFE